MFIAPRAGRSAKLRRSGMDSRLLGAGRWVCGGQNLHSCRSSGACSGLRGGHCYKYGAPDGAWLNSSGARAC